MSRSDAYILRKILERVGVAYYELSVLIDSTPDKDTSSKLVHARHCLSMTQQATQDLIKAEQETEQ